MTTFKDASYSSSIELLEDAIDHSIAHNEIVRIEGDVDAIAACLQEAYPDHDCDSCGRDVWSTDGDEWRLLVVRADASEVL